tara:strand:- start:4281 stop:5183 length:903 start_codon:yes stop_codon:yes gene_type:complete
MSVNNSLGNDGFPTPVGTILPFFGKQANRLPSAWLYCDGRELVKTDYPELYATIGDDFNLTTTTTGSFCLPQLALGDNYLYPSDETEAGGDGGVSPAKIQFDGELTLRDVEIPSLSAANITTTYATKQVGFARGVTYNVRGDYGDYAANSIAIDTPEIVKLGATKEGGGTFSLTSADYKFKNSNQKSITDITTDVTHSIQYGGMSCPYIMKVSSLLYDADGTLRKNINNVAVAAKEYADEQAAVAAAYASQTNQRNQRADDRAQKQALAIRADGQGGGTEVPFDDTPMLSGFVIPANPQY